MIVIAYYRPINVPRGQPFELFIKIKSNISLNCKLMIYLPEGYGFDEKTLVRNKEYDLVGTVIELNDTIYTSTQAKPEEIILEIKDEFKILKTEKIRVNVI